jgi:hypothetical protein
MSNAFTNFFARIGHWFSSSKGQATLKEIENVAIEAEPIVEMISTQVPASNRTFANIKAAYENIGVPLAMTEEQLTDPLQQALALRDLAVKKLRENHQEVSANVLNAGIELAVAHVTTK